MVDTVFDGEDRYFDVDPFLGVVSSSGAKAIHSVGGDVHISCHVFYGERAFLESDTPSCKFSRCSRAVKEPFKCVIVGSQCDIDAFETLSEHQSSPDNGDLFACEGVVIALGVVKGMAKVTYEA